MSMAKSMSKARSKSLSKAKAKPKLKPKAKSKTKPSSRRGQIIRHGEPKELLGVSYLTVKEMDAIQDHVRRYVGGECSVLHEIMSEGLHIDVLSFPPTAKRKYHVLCTMGMSAEPMTMPARWRGPRRMELLMILPPEWRIDRFGDGKRRRESEEKQERWYWPVRWLKNLAHIPQMYETMLWWGHTVPNGDPPEPFADNTRFCCAALLFPQALSEGIASVVIGGKSQPRKSRKEVAFLAVAPLFPEEVERKLREGMEPIDEGLQGIPIESWFRESRPNFGLSAKA